ncbi:unnamed protein product [Sphenostylis stenocarpa]|uniref:Uncharacterized protein n=1 Tax=Sphenostylis stenocarpa TaxID=92480 RepID=A0AA86STP5_9FABA|nr:unnamed protein product [Sphenostylis stenocarpa]
MVSRARPRSTRKSAKRGWENSYARGRRSQNARANATQTGGMERQQAVAIEDLERGGIPGLSGEQLTTLINLLKTHKARGIEKLSGKNDEWLDPVNNKELESNLIDYVFFDEPNESQRNKGNEAWITNITKRERLGNCEHEREEQGSGSEVTISEGNSDDSGQEEGVAEQEERLRKGQHQHKPSVLL